MPFPDAPGGFLVNKPLKRRHGDAGAVEFGGSSFQEFALIGKAALAAGMATSRSTAKRSHKDTTHAGGPAAFSTGARPCQKRQMG